MNASTATSSNPSSSSSPGQIFRILVVDDDPAVVRGVSGLLRDEGYRTTSAQSAAEAFTLLQRDAPDLVLLDVRMPGESGLELLKRLPRPLPAPVVVLSGEASAGEAVQSLKLGATDFVEKPPSAERLLTAVKNALAISTLSNEGSQLREALNQPGHLVGESAPMALLRTQITRVGPSEAIVLIQGETGTGKERVARALHQASGRQGRFVAVNCAAIPSNLLESELFGYEKGAFSGAQARHPGRLEQAQRGTVLLDELGDMPLELQAKLLRVLEQREVERLGGTHPVPIDVRFVAATHRDLRQHVAEGKFREDLFYRLNVFPMRVPALRERPDDIRPLARTFAADLLGHGGSIEVTPSGDALLRSYPWPGNVRELKNLIERLTLLRPPGAPLILDESTLADLLRATSSIQKPLPASMTTAVPTLGAQSYREMVEDFERALLRSALEQCDRNVAAAARLLKVDRGNLYRRIKALDLPIGEEPEPM
jgi:DNA-binding NtrC family response regulator